MDAAEYVVPAVLRDAMFVPGQAAGRPGHARVTAGAFRAAGLPVPGHPAQRNIYQLTGRQGLPWTPGLDAHIGRRGGELLGHGRLILVDIDTPAAADGIPVADRRINYSRIDPEIARDVFIQQALIEDRWHRGHAFMDHNREVLEEAHRLE